MTSLLKNLPSKDLPDMRYINREINILEIARKLDLRVDPCGKIHCWHGEQHQHGDRTASVGVRRSNNTVRCFGCCDSKPMTVLDLVMAIRNFKNVADAAEWIDSRFPVPRIQARKTPMQINTRPIGLEGPLGLLICSGLWGRLSAPTCVIAPVLYELSDKDSYEKHQIQISYAAISRYSGVKSPNAIRKALIELQEVGWLVLPEKIPPLERLRRTAPTYTLTPYSDQLIELADCSARQTRQEIEAEKQIRARSKQLRRRLIATGVPWKAAAA
jgi:hypothetical protein